MWYGNCNANKDSSVMQQVKTAIKGFCALILALALICLIYVHFKRADLSQRVLVALRGELATELQVAYFNMDLLSSFPRISFDMHDVILDGKGGSKLLQAEELQLTMSLFSAFSDEIRFRRLSLKNGEVYVERLKDGTLSLDILKSSDRKETVEPVLHFNKISLENVGIEYLDPTLDQEYQLHFLVGNITGTYASQLLKFDLSGEVVYDHARIQKSVYLNGMKGNASGRIALDLDDQLYTFEDLRLEIGDLRYEINGNVHGTDDAQNIDLVVKQTDGDLHSFLALLPTAYRKDLPFSKVSGAFITEGFIKGRLNRSENPHVHFDLQLDDASIESRHGSGSLHDLEIYGAFDNGAFRRLRSASIDFPVIKGNAYGQKFDASLSVTDFTDPLLQCTFEGSLPATFILDYIGKPDVIKTASGSLHFTDVAIGPLRLNEMDFTDLQHFEGRCTLGNLEVRTAAAHYQIHDGILILAQDTLNVSGVKMKLDHDEILVDGWLAELGDALESNDPAYLRYAVNLKAGSLNISKWIPGIAASTAHEIQARARPVSLHTSTPLRLPEGEIMLIADQFQYNQIEATKLSMIGFTKTHHVRFEATGEAAKGSLVTKGELEIQNGYQLKLQVDGKDLDIRECFTQCENFGQQILLAEHLQGKSAVKVLAELIWDVEGNLDEEQMHILAGMTIIDGELHEFDMLDQFSDYVHAEDLRYIRFSHLDNFIEVRNGNVYIPAMFIQSNAANLVVNGVHTLDNQILYNIKVNAGQVLAAKMKKHNPKLLPLPARKNGTFNLLFTVAGSMDAFKYDINKRAAESSFAQSTELRDRIREQLRAAFGETIDLIEPPEWETIPEYDMEQEGEEIFLDVIDRQE